MQYCNGFCFIFLILFSIKESETRFMDNLLSLSGKPSNENNDSELSDGDKTQNDLKPNSIDQPKKTGLGIVGLENVIVNPLQDLVNKKFNVTKDVLRQIDGSVQPPSSGNEENKPDKPLPIDTTTEDTIPLRTGDCKPMIVVDGNHLIFQVKPVVPEDEMMNYSEYSNQKVYYNGEDDLSSKDCV